MWFTSDRSQDMQKTTQLPNARHAKYNGRWCTSPPLLPYTLSAQVGDQLQIQRRKSCVWPACVIDVGFNWDPSRSPFRIFIQYLVSDGGHRQAEVALHGRQNVVTENKVEKWTKQLKRINSNQPSKCNKFCNAFASCYNTVCTVLNSLARLRDGTPHPWLEHVY